MKLIDLVSVIFCVTGIAYFIECFLYSRAARARDQEHLANSRELLAIRRVELSDFQKNQSALVTELNKRLEQAHRALAVETQAHTDLRELTAKALAKKGRRRAKGA